MAKIDITAFFRHIDIDQADWPLMGFRWEGKRFLDTRLNFEQRNAPEAAYRFAMAVLWSVQCDITGMSLQSWLEVFVVCDD